MRLSQRITFGLLCLVSVLVIEAEIAAMHRMGSSRLTR
jgi:hypothetical protein